MACPKSAEVSHRNKMSSSGHGMRLRLVNSYTQANTSWQPVHFFTKTFMHCIYWCFPCAANWHSYKAWNEPSCELSSNLYLLLLVTIMHVKGERARKEREVEIGAQLFTEIFCGANFFFFSGDKTSEIGTPRYPGLWSMDAFPWADDLWSEWSIDMRNVYYQSYTNSCGR